MRQPAAIALTFVLAVACSDTATQVIDSGPSGPEPPPGSPSENEFRKLLPSSGAAGDAFGSSVALSGDVAVVGAPSDDESGADAGAAYVFVQSGGTWSQVATLTAADGAAGDAFGTAVAASGDLAVVGAPDDDDAGTDSGSAYVFQRSGDSWSQVVKLVAGDGAAGDSFGASVAVSGSVAVVGAPRDDDAGADSGSAYAFDGASAWALDGKLAAADGAAGDLFGLAVSVSAGIAVVGAPNDDDGGTDSGSAYLFDEGSEWSQLVKLVADDGAAGDAFGAAVAVQGDHAVVGARGDDDGGTDSGSAYVFDGASGWSRVAKLTAADGAAGDGFGTSVTVDNTLAVVGSPGEDDPGPDAGSAYVFDGGSGWDQLVELEAADGGTGDALGGAVSLSGEVTVVGAPFDDDGGAESGAAYLFDLSSG